MKKLFLFVLIITSSLYSQKGKFKFHPDVSVDFITNHYFGDTYLSKGHQNQSIGFQIKSNIVDYSNFKLGFGVEKSTQKVTDYSIGGDIAKTNTNSIFGQLSYTFKVGSKFRVSPELNYGGIELRQKKGQKLYGIQSGKRYGIGVNLNYMLTKYFSLHTNLGYSSYALNTNTTSEYKNYFSKANTVSLSLGIKFN